MRPRRTLVGGLAFCGFAAAAGAQVPPGQFDRPAQFVAQSTRSEEMGACAVRFDRRRAVEVVLTHGGDAEGQEAIKAFLPALTKCLHGSRSATLNATYLRGGIAEALLRENDATLLMSAAKLPPVAPARVRFAETKEPVIALIGCAAAAQPGDAAAVIASPAESPAEAAAFGRLSPSLQACAPASGEVHITPARVRPATAIAVYRLVTTR